MSIEKKNHKIRTQDYAKVAYPLVESVYRSSYEAKYRTLALNFPTMIMQSGLSQAVGFLMAKSSSADDEYSLLLNHIAKLLGYPNSSTLHTVILKSSLGEYQLLTRRSLDATAWVKRYTQALLEKA
ncbi:type III-B CRISPR module-associated protein Cmr5 [Ignatzschineria ureiclastica]|uniref:CRISPR type III-B/RAMP module-associated protein Cmr5 n=1 Tax=Ignatzschineria ureiclastica TaxID=472582 RepID=A0A2U2AFK3_9GAMM|nr:type III-B CRISPR module-associated protein Cmr5 [Ignatzschineria ureiclastica]PWD81397.1 type III-B CRISPR module-associated protein Cmr5 [Ignatzschineria ureiclastica]